MNSGSRSKARVTMALVAAGLLSACLLVAAPPPASATGAGLPGEVRLSNERTVTRWASPLQSWPIRARPQSSALPVATLRPFTEDGLPEVYPLLVRWSDPDGRTWVQVRVPMRPNGRTGWVDSAALGSVHVVTTLLIVDRRKLSATLYRSGAVIWRSRVGVGGPRTPTPAGRFWIREQIKAQDPRGTYGPWAFGTGAYSPLSDWPGGGVVGIHGTNEPELIPGRPSHGCIRVPNRAIRALARLMPIGTPVWIR